MSIPAQGYAVLDVDHGVCGPVGDVRKSTGVDLPFFADAVSALAAAEHRGLTRRFLLVRALGERRVGVDGSVLTNRLKVVEEVPLEEFLQLCTGRAVLYQWGHPVIDVTYLRGKKHGTELQYHTCGTLATSALYQEGKLEGLRMVYNEDDKKLFHAGTYKNGMRHGDHMTYHSNGRVAVKETFVDNVRDGELKAYHHQGGLARSEVFVRGERHGKYVVYHANGRIAEIAHYVHDALAGQRELYDEHGRRLEIQSWRDGKLHGLRRVYNGKGRKIASYRYDLGLRHGPFTQWDSTTGQLSRSGEYVQDKLVRSMTRDVSAKDDVQLSRVEELYV